MGAVCENVTVTNSPIEDIEATRVSYYEPATWPEDTHLQQKLQELKAKEGTNVFNEGNEQFLSTHVLKKHRLNNEYYLGEWDPAGYQKGKGIMYKPGELYYQGDFDTVPHGSGTLDDFKNKFTYTGQFKHGKIQGHGIFAKYHNLYSYEGAINSESHPTTGTLTVNNDPDPTKCFRAYLDKYPSSPARIEYKDGSEYVGYVNLQSFVPEGEGTARYSNGSSYQGDWLNGQFHGKGKFSWKDGSKYVGDYVLGKKHGEGVFMYPSKKVYRGSWAQGKQEGSGALYSPSGQLLKKGLWRDGVFEKESDI